MNEDRKEAGESLAVMFPNGMAGSNFFPLPMPQFPQMENGNTADDFLSKALRTTAEYIHESNERPHPGEQKRLCCASKGPR